MYNVSNSPEKGSCMLSIEPELEVFKCMTVKKKKTLSCIKIKRRRRCHASIM
jgi:hypothetical protein